MRYLLFNLASFLLYAPLLFTPSLPFFPFSLHCLSLLNGSSDPITERRCCGADGGEEEMEGGAAGGEDGRMDYILWV